MCKRRKVRYGALYPIGTILYSCTSFVWEEYRNHDHIVKNEFFLELTYWQCWAIIAIIVSVIWLVILYAKREYKECALESRIDYKDIYDKIHCKVKKTLGKNNKKKDLHPNTGKKKKKKKKK